MFLVSVCVCVHARACARICGVQLFSLAEGKQAIYSSAQPSGLL